MIYQSSTIDLSRLKLYYPELKETFKRLNHTEVNGLKFNVDLAYDLPETELKPFETRFALLMNKYNIVEEFWTDLTYINQIIITELENVQFFSELDPETSNAIDFLIGYQDLVKQESKSGKNSAKNDPFVIQFKRKSQNGGINLNYHGSAKLVVKLIYKAFKTSFNNPTLSNLLEDYKEIPPINVLEEFIMPPNIKRNNLAKMLLQESAEILSDYFEKHIPKNVFARKKNLIIFELFYLFDTFRYAGSILNIDTSNIRRRNLNTIYTLPTFKDHSYSEIIKELIKKGKAST